MNLAQRHTDAELPLIDFASFRAGSVISRRRVIRQLCDATRDTGFFYLRSFGIAPEVVSNAFVQSRAFFSRPADLKREVMWDRSNRGYDGIEAQSFNSSQPGDLKESFRFTAEPTARNQPHPAAAWSFLANQPNKWPKGMPEFRSSLLRFSLECGDLVEDILFALEETLALREPLLRRLHAKRNYTMRLLHYPAVASQVKDGQARCGEHTDWGTITLLFQEGQGGLEVRRPSGEWTPAPPLKDCVLVNIGDELQAWTKDIVVSTPHRITADSADHEKPRYSIALFAYADFDAKLGPENAQTSGDYLLSKLAETQSVGKAR